MLRTAPSHSSIGLLTLGFDPARFPWPVGEEGQIKLPACYWATWHLLRPDFHQSATASSRISLHHSTFTRK